MNSASGTPGEIGTRSGNLENDAIKKLHLLVRLIGQLHRATSRSRRIQRGSPGTGGLSDSMSRVRDIINRFKPQIVSLLETIGQYPGMQELKAQLDRFDSVLNDEEGHDDGYTDRVYYLEKIDYESGALKGHMQAMIAHVEHGQSDQRSIRRLSYEEDNNQPVPVPPMLLQDSSYNGGDVAGIICEVIKYRNSRFFRSRNFRFTIFRVKVFSFFRTPNENFLQRKIFREKNFRCSISTRKYFYNEINANYGTHFCCIGYLYLCCYIIFDLQRVWTKTTVTFLHS